MRYTVIMLRLISIVAILIQFNDPPIQFCNALSISQHTQRRTILSTTNTQLQFSATAYEQATSPSATKEEYLDFVSNALLEPPPTSSLLLDTNYESNNIDRRGEEQSWPASDNDDWHLEYDNNISPSMMVDSREQIHGGSPQQQQPYLDYNIYTNLIPRSSRHSVLQQELGNWQTTSTLPRQGRSARTNNNSSVRCNSISGSERRATFTSYAPSQGTSKRSRTMGGGVVGSPGGVDNWSYTTSYGPATTATSSSRAIKRSSTTNQRRQASASSSLRDQQLSYNYGMTGRERRSSFNSFGPIQTITRQSDAQSSSTNRRRRSSVLNEQPVQNSLSPRSRNDNRNSVTTSARDEAVRVKAQIDTLSNNNYQDFNEPAIEQQEQDTSDEVGDMSMSTPARRSLPSHFSLRSMPGKGLGVITNKPFWKGEFIGDYKGEIMSEEVKDRRYLKSLENKLTDEDRAWIQSRLDRGQTLTGCYLYGVSLDDEDVHKRFFKKHDEEEDTTPNRVYVDAEDEYESLWTRFINHASPPYNNVNPKSVPESYDGKPRVWFMANRDIAPGEEICFDYGDDYWLEGDDVV